MSYWWEIELKNKCKIKGDFENLDMEKIEMKWENLKKNFEDANHEYELIKIQDDVFSIQFKKRNVDYNSLEMWIKGQKVTVKVENEIARISRSDFK